MVLDTVTRKDAGQYQCRADNGVGNPKFKKIELLVNCKYIFNKMKSLKVAK